MTFKYSFPRSPKPLSTQRPVHRLPKLRGPKKARYRLEGGPLHGGTLYLSDGTTMRMTFGGVRGCYRAAMVGRPGVFGGKSKWCPDVV